MSFFNNTVFSFLCLSVILTSCNASDEPTTDLEKKTIPDSLIDSKSSAPAVSYNLFMLDSTINSAGYGYDILINGERYIHQTNIPAVSGNQFFVSMQEAKTTAMYVCYKIQNNIMPPTISVHELDSLGISIN